MENLDNTELLKVLPDLVTAYFKSLNLPPATPVPYVLDNDISFMYMNIMKPQDDIFEDSKYKDLITRLELKFHNAPK